MELDLNTDLLRLLPPWYREVEDYRQICNAEKSQFDRLAAGVKNIQDTFFVQSMDADSVQRWEQVFHIRARPAVETLEFRRQRVLTRLRIRPPYTMTFLYQQMDELLGTGNWFCQVDYPAYTLRMVPNVEKQQLFGEMLRLIHAVKPAHIVLENTPYLRTSLLLSEQINSSYRTLNYRLGRWNLGRLPFGTDGKAAQRKAPQDTSLTGALRHTAGILSDALSESRFNEKSAGTSLEKNVSTNDALPGQMLTVKTTVPDGISYLTTYELLDRQKTPAVRFPLHFPVAGPAGMILQLAVFEDADTTRYIYRYLLEDWELGTHPFAEEKPAYTERLGRSAVLQKTLLHQTAQHLAESITAVQLNGSILRKKFKIQVSESSLTVSHEIAAPEGISVITSIELLAGDTPLTHSVVSIPVRELTILTHTINLQEGVFNG